MLVGRKERATAKIGVLFVFCDELQPANGDKGSAVLRMAQSVTQCGAAVLSLSEYKAGLSFGVGELIAMAVVFLLISRAGHVYRQTSDPARCSRRADTVRHHRTLTQMTSEISAVANDEWYGVRSASCDAGHTINLPKRV
jgi:hypothetical protein